MANHSVYRTEYTQLETKPIHKKPNNGITNIRKKTTKNAKYYIILTNS